MNYITCKISFEINNTITLIYDKLKNSISDKPFKENHNNFLLVYNDDCYIYRRQLKSV